MNTTEIKRTIREIPNYPKEGILFYDITTLLKDKEAFSALIDQLVESVKDREIDVVIGPESRGFIMGTPVAYLLKAGFVPARKPGKLPAETTSIEYGLEYGTDKIELHVDAISNGTKVLIVDDLLATGGTAKAVCDLVERMGGEVVGLRFAIELNELNGRKMLEGYDVKSILEY